MSPNIRKVKDLALAVVEAESRATVDEDLTLQALLRLQRAVHDAIARKIIVEKKA